MESAPGVLALCWCPESRFVAWSCSDGRVRQWDNEEQCVLNPFVLPSAKLLEYSRPQPTFIAVADAKKSLVRMVKSSSGEQLCVATPATGVVSSDAPVVAMTPPFVADSNLETASGNSSRAEDGSPPKGTYACATRSSVWVFRYSSELVASLSGGENVVSAAFPPSDGPEPQRIATGESKGVCRVWNISGGSAVCLLVLKSHSGWVTGLSFSANEGRRLATSSFDGTAKVWDVEAKRPTLLLSIPPVSKAEKLKLHAVSFTGDAEAPFSVAVGGADCAVRVLHVEGKGVASGCPEPVALFRGHAKTIFALEFAPDGSRVASGSSDGYVRMWTLPAAPVVLSRPSTAAPVSTPDTLGPPRLVNRMLIYCPEDATSLKCGICMNAFNATSRRPFVSGSCGHTYACAICNEKLHSTEGSVPRCPQCRSELTDVAPNFELIRVLSPAKTAGTDEELPGLVIDAVADFASMQPSSPVGERVESSGCYVDLDRIQWIEAPESEVASSAYTKTLLGRLDFEAALVTMSLRVGEKNSELASEAKKRMENNVAHMARLRGPHILQFYGASRLRAPDRRIVIVSEEMHGGSLALNYVQFRETHCAISVDAVLSISLQLCRALLFLHRSGVARPTLHPGSIFLSHSLSEWCPSACAKLGDFGGSISRRGASAARSVALMTSGPVAYLPPEALDPSMNNCSSDSAAFDHACRMDMFSLGVVIWELASGTKPWDGLRGAQIVSAVVGRHDRPGFVPSHLPTEVRNLIDTLWAQDPHDRLSAEQAVIALDIVPSAPPSPRL